MHILIDYLTVSFPLFPNEIFKYLHIKDDEFTTNKSSLSDYDYCHYFNGIKVHSCYEFSGSKNYGRTCLEMSGIGCRTLESLYKRDGLIIDWKFLILSFMILDCTFTRLDVCYDDFDGIFTMEKIYNHFFKEKYICKAQNILPMPGTREQGIYFGAPASDKRLRIYNKALERKVSYPWIRVELQLRKDSAESFINNWFKFDDLGYTYSGVLKNFLRFVTKPYNGMNSDRYKTSPFWSKLIGNCEKIKTYLVGGLEYNLDSLERYVEKQTLSSLKTYIITNGGDVSKLLDKVAVAELNIKQKTLLNNLEM